MYIYGHTDVIKIAKFQYKLLWCATSIYNEISVYNYIIIDMNKHIEIIYGYDMEKHLTVIYDKTVNDKT